MNSEKSSKVNKSPLFFCSGGARDETQGLTFARAISPVLEILLL
jgi:hypothetical protein